VIPVDQTSGSVPQSTRVDDQRSSKTPVGEPQTVTKKASVSDPGGAGIADQQPSQDALVGVDVDQPYTSRDDGSGLTTDMTQNQNSPDRCNSNPRVPSDSTRDTPNASRPQCNRKRPARYCNLIRIGNLDTALPVDDACISMGADSIHHTYPGSCKAREYTVRSGEVRDHFFCEGIPVSLPLGEAFQGTDTDLSVVSVFATSTMTQQAQRHHSPGEADVEELPSCRVQQPPSTPSISRRWRSLHQHGDQMQVKSAGRRGTCAVVQYVSTR